MLRTAFLIAVMGIGLTLLSGSGFSRDRHAAPAPNWGAAANSQPARHAPPVAPRNWATPR
jgi:hypothetical protein